MGISDKYFNGMVGMKTLPEQGEGIMGGDEVNIASSVRNFTMKGIEM